VCVTVCVTVCVCVCVCVCAVGDGWMLVVILLLVVG
jgi:hypothetical protein